MLTANNDALAFDLGNRHDVDVRSRLQNPHDVLTVAEAAVVLRCGPRSVRRLCKLGRIKHVTLDRKKTIRIHRSALDAFLLGQKGGGTPRG